MSVGRVKDTENKRDFFLQENWKSFRSVPPPTESNEIVVNVMHVLSYFRTSNKIVSLITVLFCEETSKARRNEEPSLHFDLSSLYHFLSLVVLFCAIATQPCKSKIE